MFTGGQHRSTCTFVASLSAFFVALGLGVLASLGCKRTSHSESAQASGHTQYDGHDHGGTGGHDHGSEAHADEVVLSSEAVERYGVKVEEAQRWVLRPTFVSPGQVAFNGEAMAHVGSPLPGRAVEILVRVGDVVAKDQPLVVVESAELGEAQADYFQKRIAVESAGPAADLAKVAWERAKGLHEQSQGIALSEVQRREAEYRAAVAAQRAAEGAVTGAENRLHLLGMTQEAVAELAKSGRVSPRFTIKAPAAGTVVEREVTLGELVGPERESLLVLADTSTLWVLAEVHEGRVPAVMPGAKAWVIATSVQGSRFEGEVSHVSPMIDAGTRTAQVRVVVPASELPLKAGMFAQVEIVASTSGTDPEPVIAVPDAAVQTVEGGPAVFVPVEGEPNTFAKRSVTVGKPVGGLVPIYAGLVEGERFVSAGTFILKADMGKGSAAHEH